MDFPTATFRPVTCSVEHQHPDRKHPSKNTFNPRQWASMLRMHRHCIVTLLICSTRGHLASRPEETRQTRHLRPGGIRPTDRRPTTRFSEVHCRGVQCAVLRARSVLRARRRFAGPGPTVAAALRPKHERQTGDRAICGHQTAFSVVTAIPNPASDQTSPQNPWHLPQPLDVPRGPRLLHRLDCTSFFCLPPPPGRRPHSSLPAAAAVAAAL